MGEVLEVSAGDTVFRDLPGGRTEVFDVLSEEVTNAIGSIPIQHTLIVRKQGDRRDDNRSQTSNIHQANAVQIGDHNRQEVSDALGSLVREIDEVAGDPAVKREAKSRFAAFLHHPLVATVLGKAAGPLLSSLSEHDAVSDTTSVSSKGGGQ